MGSTWGPSGSDRTQVSPMMAPWTLLSGTPLYENCWYDPKIIGKMVTYIKCVQNRMICLLPGWTSKQWYYRITISGGEQSPKWFQAVTSTASWILRVLSVMYGYWDIHRVPGILDNAGTIYKCNRFIMLYHYKYNNVNRCIYNCLNTKCDASYNFYRHCYYETGTFLSYYQDTAGQVLSVDHMSIRSSEYIQGPL